MQSYLIIGGTQEQRQQEATKISRQSQVSQVDQINFEESGIDQVRQLQHQLNLKPYQSRVKLAFISQAEKLTIPAQNAMLKTLEEPPANTIIILASPTIDQLLPTIVSRCQIIRLKTEDSLLGKLVLNSQLSYIKAILKAGVGERLKIAEEIAVSREKAIDFCQGQLVIWRQKMKQSPPGLKNQDRARTIRQIQKALSFLEANVNPRLTLENLLLHYPQPTLRTSAPGAE